MKNKFVFGYAFTMFILTLLASIKLLLEFKTDKLGLLIPCFILFCSGTLLYDMFSIVKRGILYEKK